ncbi:MAG: glycosyltransferase [Candidatus Woesearchaeota archaeon]
MNKFCLIISLSAPWYNHPRKHFFEAIADTIKSYEGYVLCIEPTILSLHTLIMFPERISGWIRGKFNFRQEAQNIYVVPAHTIEHILLSVRFKPLIPLNGMLLKRQIRKSIKKIDNNIKDIILFLHRPELYYLVGRLGEKGVIYDCCDDYCLTSYMGKMKVAGNEKREKILAEKCNFIITSAELLYQRNLNYNQNTYLIENGFGKTYFQNAALTKIEALEKMKGPVIGYIGNLRNWIDFEILEFIISNKPEWNFVFAGEIRKNVKKEFGELLRKYKNVYSTGWIHYSKFPDYLQYFDVGIIPFNVNAFMESANPNKLYDYIASGVPVVSTNIGDLKTKYYNFVKVAENKEEFLQKIEEYLNQSIEEKKVLKNEMEKYSQNHSWEDNARIVFSLIKEKILI